MHTATLSAALRRLLGADAVLDTPAQLAPYRHDWIPGNYPLPDLVALPGHPDQVPAIVALASAAGVPVVARGAGTGLAGGARPSRGGLVIATTRLTAIERVDLPNRQALVQPGLITYDLSAALAPQGWFYAPDPASWRMCSIGGNIANNSGGPRCLKYGVTTNHVLAVELTLHDGRSLWTGDGIPEAAGYDLTGLVVGSEGTFGVVTRALLRLTRAPEANRVALALFPDVVAACAAVSAILAAGYLPTALEVMDATTMLAVNRAQQAGLPEEAGAALIIEVDGVEDGLDATMAAIVALCRAEGAFDLRTAATAAEQERLWSARRSAFASFHTIAPSYYLVDTVVPRTRLPAMMAHVQRLSARYAMPIANVFHAGDGNLHPLVLYDPADPAQVEKAHAITAEILELSIAEGGAVSGEHGIGSEKQDFLARLYGPAELAAQAAIYTIFNPANRLNPGKIFPADMDPLALALARNAALAAMTLPVAAAVLRAELAAIVGTPYLVQGEPAAAYTIQGHRPGCAVLPGSLEELSAVMAACHRAGATVAPWGGGSQQAAGALDAPPDVVVVTRRLAGVLHYQPDDLTIGVGAGISLAELRAALAAHGQMLPLDAPLPDRASIGGLVATAADGPRRLGYGTLRDLVLGLTVVQVDGTILRLGGQVVKNVSGYDMVKLFIGSYGTLGIIAEVRLRSFPLPPHETSVVAAFPSLAQAAGFLAELPGGVLRPSAAELVSDEPARYRAILRFEGVPAACARQSREAAALALRHGAAGVEQIEGAAHQALWARVADLAAADCGPGAWLLRLAVPPAQVAGALADLERGAARRPAPRGGRLSRQISARALGGVIYARIAGDPAAFSALLGDLAARYPHTHVLAGDLPAGAEHLRWGGPPEPAALELMRQIKAAFDPADALSRGRLGLAPAEVPQAGGFSMVG